jgi:hypothetical protein
MIPDLPSGKGQQDQQQEVKVISGEDPQRTADQEVISCSQHAGFAFLIGEQDGRDQVAAQYKEKRDKGSHVNGEGELQRSDPVGIMIEKDKEDCAEAEPVQLRPVSYDRIFLFVRVRIQNL